MFKVTIETSTDSDIHLKDLLCERVSELNYRIEDSDSTPQILHNQGHLRLFREKGNLLHETGQTSIDFLPLQRSHLICVISIPQYHTAYSNLFQHYWEYILYIRVIERDDELSTLILAFNSQYIADRFYLEFNGKEHIEESAEYLYVVYINEVIFSSRNEIVPNYVEIPVCPICIERLDVNASGVTGVLRAEMQEERMNRWEDCLRNCIVCKRVGKSTGLILKLTPTNSLDFDCCQACDEKLDLWACLICGHVGCGRYKAGHGKVHFSESGHVFSLELATQRVWDYTGDTYVHRLVHSGKSLLVLDSTMNSNAKEDYERITWEYNYLINSQLEQQRIFFEHKINTRLEEHENEMKRKLGELTHENAELKKSVSQLKNIRKRRNELQNKLNKLQDELYFQQEINRNLQEELNQGDSLPKFPTNKAKQKYLKLQKLQSRVSELMSHL